MKARLLRLLGYYRCRCIDEARLLPDSGYDIVREHYEWRERRWPATQIHRIAWYLGLDR